jgi:hypothetical protein
VLGVALVLLALSQPHLAAGIAVVTSAGPADGWLMAIGIDLGFIALELTVLVAPAEGGRGAPLATPIAASPACGSGLRAASTWPQSTVIRHQPSPARRAEIFLVPSEAPLMPVVLIAGTICSPAKASLNGRPHTTFLLKAETDGQIWRAIVYDEEELRVTETLTVGDACAIVGQLEVRAEQDKFGRSRIGFNVTAKQILLLRARSAVKAAAAGFLERPGFTRPRVG